MQSSFISSELYAPVNKYIASAVEEFAYIPMERKHILQKLATYIQKSLEANKKVKLIFICTHNSRRSHLSQIWAQTAAYYYGIENIETYSGGTEVTAFNERAVSALQRAGFDITKTDGENNSIYHVKFADKATPLEAFSKVYNAAGNPTEHFAAIMTCSQAEKACPYIPGADARIAIAYDDPKNADGFPQEEAIYDERTRQIAREMLYVFSLIKS